MVEGNDGDHVQGRGRSTVESLSDPRGTSRSLFFDFIVGMLGVVQTESMLHLRRARRYRDRKKMRKREKERVLFIKGVILMPVLVWQRSVDSCGSMLATCVCCVIVM